MKMSIAVIFSLHAWLGPSVPRYIIVVVTARMLMARKRNFLGGIFAAAAYSNLPLADEISII